MLGGFLEFGGKLLYGVFVLIVFGIVVSTIASVGLAPEPGDPFYPAWLDITRYGWEALILVVPGVVGAAYVILELLPDYGGF